MSARRNGLGSRKQLMQRWESKMPNHVKAYLTNLKRQLRWKGLYHPDVLIEAESHLLEAVEAEIQRGTSREDAELQALARFGSVKVVAQSFEKERNNIMQNLLLSAAILAGLFSLYVDTRPNWDDTGLLVIGLLLAGGLLTLLGHRRPWLIGLGIGIWIPVYNILKTHDLMMLIVLLIPMAGAYIGWLLRLGIQKTLHPA